MSKFTFFLWCCWVAFLLSLGAVILIPIAVIILPIAIIAVIAYVLA
jgi:hypothetical protein